MRTTTAASFHHIEIHTIQPDYILQLFTKTYGFQIIASRRTEYYQQWFLRSGECRLIISSVLSEFDVDLTTVLPTECQDYDILLSILQCSTTRELIIKRDTVFNVALQVKSIDRILENNPGLKVLKSPRLAVDAFGSIKYACIKSCVGNVVHTLIDTSEYTGPSLPGFTAVSDLVDESFIVRHIDHVAFAVEQNQAISMMAWYEKVFGFSRFFVNREDDPFQGFTVRVGTRGMRLFASEYWKCSETACMESESSSLKFVFSESLLKKESNTPDQITTFIRQHKHQAGIQHLGFSCFADIKDAVRRTKLYGAQYLAPMSQYYLRENNGRLIEAAGESPQELNELGILLDSETDSSQEPTDGHKVLLQIFTKSIFNNDTFFLELIERRGACGFGAGNIRALWKIVQSQMDGR